jgi:hypothetical protein
MEVSTSMRSATLYVPDSSVRPIAALAPLPERLLAFADRNRHKLFALLIAMYLLGFNAQWRLEQDSALYLTLGRNLAEGAGYTYHGIPHHLAFPGLPLLFAGTFKIFHTQSTLPAVVMMLLLGVLTLVLTYRLFLLHSGRPTAVLLTVGVGMCRLFYKFSFELLSDMPFLLGVMAFLVGYEAVFHQDAEGRVHRRPRWYDYALMLAGLTVAIAMRPAMWGLLLAIALTLAWLMVRNPVRLPQVAILIAVIVAGVLFWKLDLRRVGDHSVGEYEEQWFAVTLTHWRVLLHQMFFEYIPRLFEASLSQALFGARLGPGLSSLAGVGVIVVSATMLRHRPLWLMWVAMTFVMVLVAIKPLDRYFLEVLPLLVFAWWSGLVWLNRRLPQGIGPIRLSRRWANAVFVALLFLGGATNLMRMGEFIIEQRRSPFLNYYKEGKFASVDRVARLLHHHVEPDAWVLCPPKYARILTYLSRRKVAEPFVETRLDPAEQTIYVLEPLNDPAHPEVHDTPVRQWLQSTPARLDPKPIGPTIKSKFDVEPWELHQAVPATP